MPGSWPACGRFGFGFTFKHVSYLFPITASLCLASISELQQPSSSRGVGSPFCTPSGSFTSLVTYSHNPSCDSVPNLNDIEDFKEVGRSALNSSKSAPCRVLQLFYLLSQAASLVAVRDGVHGSFDESQVNGGVINGKRRHMRNSCLYKQSCSCFEMRTCLLCLRRELREQKKSGRR